MTVHVSAAVRDETIRIARWYNTQPGCYGSCFLDEFEAALERIERGPRSCPPAEDGRDGHEDREYFIARFEQRVIFTVAGDDAYVLTVVHASRDERAWHRNLPEDLTPGS